MRTFNDSWILNWASEDKPRNFMLISRTASKKQGRKATVLRTMTTNNVTVSFLSDDTAPAAEKAVIEQLINHCTTHQLLPVNQFTSHPIVNTIPLKLRL